MQWCTFVRMKLGWRGKQGQGCAPMRVRAARTAWLRPAVEGGPRGGPRALASLKPGWVPPPPPPQTLQPTPHTPPTHPPQMPTCGGAWSGWWRTSRARALPAVPRRAPARDPPGPPAAPETPSSMHIGTHAWQRMPGSTVPCDGCQPWGAGRSVALRGGRPRTCGPQHCTNI